jgi:hypothetical protein
MAMKRNIYCRRLHCSTCEQSRSAVKLRLTAEASKNGGAMARAYSVDEDIARVKDILESDKGKPMWSVNRLNQY